MLKTIDQHKKSLRVTLKALHKQDIKHRLVKLPRPAKSASAKRFAIGTMIRDGTDSANYGTITGYGAITYRPGLTVPVYHIDHPRRGKGSIPQDSAVVDQRTVEERYSFGGFRDGQKVSLSQVPAPVRQAIQQMHSKQEFASKWDARSVNIFAIAHNESPDYGSVEFRAVWKRRPETDPHRVGGDYVNLVINAKGRFITQLRNGQKSARKGYDAQRSLEGAVNGLMTAAANARVLRAGDLERFISGIRGPLVEYARTEGLQFPSVTGYPDYGSREDAKEMWGIARATLQGVRSSIAALASQASPAGRSALTRANQQVASAISKCQQQENATPAGSDAGKYLFGGGKSARKDYTPDELRQRRAGDARTVALSLANIQAGQVAEVIITDYGDSSWDVEMRYSSYHGVRVGGALAVYSKSAVNQIVAAAQRAGIKVTRKQDFSKSAKAADPKQAVTQALSDLRAGRKVRLTSMTGKPFDLVPYKYQSPSTVGVGAITYHIIPVGSNKPVGKLWFHQVQDYLERALGVKSSKAAVSPKERAALEYLVNHGGRSFYGDLPGVVGRDKTGLVVTPAGAKLINGLVQKKYIDLDDGLLGGRYITARVILTDKGRASLAGKSATVKSPPKPGGAAAAALRGFRNGFSQAWNKWNPKDQRYTAENPMWRGGSQAPAIPTMAEIEQKFNTLFDDFFRNNYGGMPRELTQVEFNNMVQRVAGSVGVAVAVNKVFGKPYQGYPKPEEIARYATDEVNRRIDKLNAIWEARVAEKERLAAEQAQKPKRGKGRA